MAHCTLYSRSIGWIPVDLFLSETPTDELAIAEHPVELGASISDHAWYKPRTISIKGIITRGGPMAGYEALLELQRSREPFDLQTGLSLYESMLIQKLTATRSKDNGQICEFDATCREIIIVSTEQSAGDTSGYDRATSTKNRGQVQARPVDEPKSSSGNGRNSMTVRF